MHLPRRKIFKGDKKKKKKMKNTILLDFLSLEFIFILGLKKKTHIAEVFTFFSFINLNFELYKLF